jgi:tetratricopeptide (TPR) repeat protein
LAFKHDHEGPVSHLDRVRELKSSGDYEGALLEARCALFDDPTDDEALMWIAKLAEQEGERDMAITALARLGRLREDDAAPLIREARLLLAKGDFEKALGVSQDAIDRDPDNPDCYQAAGRAYLAADQPVPAIAMFRKAVQRSPEHGYALNNLGFAYLLTNQNEEALESLVRAAELLPNVPFVQNNLGVALERVGQTEKAIEAFELAIELSPKYLKAQLNLQRLEKLLAAAEKSIADVPEPDLDGTPPGEMH